MKPQIKSRQNKMHVLSVLIIRAFYYLWFDWPDRLQSCWIADHIIVDVECSSLLKVYLYAVQYPRYHVHVILTDNGDP